MNKQIHRSHSPLFLWTQCPWVVTGLLWFNFFHFISQTFVCLKCRKTQHRLSSSINTIIGAIVKLPHLPLPFEKGTSGSVIWWEMREARLSTMGKWSVRLTSPTGQTNRNSGLAGLPWPSAEKKNSHCGFILEDLAEQPGTFSNVRVSYYSYSGDWVFTSSTWTAGWPCR